MTHDIGKREAKMASSDITKFASLIIWGVLLALPVRHILSYLLINPHDL